jgi:hypothetical protein
VPRKRKTLAGGNAQPIVAPSGGPYGSRQALEQAQRVAPVAAGSPSPAPAAPAPLPSALDAAAAHPAPTNIPLSAPTQYPGEPFTAGLDIGPGPGASPQGDPFSDPNLPPRLLMSLELLAGLPDATDATRNLVRRLRSRI